MPADAAALARELLTALESGTTLPAPTSGDESFSLADAYAVEAELVRLRAAAGHRPSGLKVGFANKAMWRILKLDTLVWAHMYDDTVHFSTGGPAGLALPHYRSPKAEPEIVFRVKDAVPPGLDAAGVLSHVDWLAIGFEIIDCPYPDWQFKPPDFVAAGGLHVGLVVGEPVQVAAEAIPALVDQLAKFRVKVTRDGEFVEEGSGKNSLRSPALCLAELATATRLSAGDLVSSGTLTAGHPCAQGQTWSVEVDGLPLSGLTLSLR